VSADATVVRSRRSSPRGEERRRALLDAIERLLRDRSIAELGVGEITDAAGVGRSAFYFYFASKEAAVAELLQDVFATITDEVAPFFDRVGDPAATVPRAMGRFVAVWREHEHLVNAVLDARANPETRRLWDGWVERFVTPVAETIDAERASGRAPAGPDARLLTRTLLGMNERALERLRDADDRDATAEDTVAVLSHTWFLAIYGAPA